MPNELSNSCMEDDNKMTEFHKYILLCFLKEHKVNKNIVLSDTS